MCPHQAAGNAGIAISYDTRAVALIYDGERVSGVRSAVVLACGGVEANAVLHNAAFRCGRV
jgi:hypothetical protein